MRPREWLAHPLAWLTAVPVLVAAVPAALLAAIWLWGGLDTTGEEVDWAAVSALAATAAAAATTFAAGSVVFAARQLRLEREADRVVRQPYLRVDLDLEGFGSDATFQRPGAPRIYDAGDFGADHLHGAVEALTDGESPLGLLLLVRNLQESALGFAYDVIVEVRIAWTLPDAPGEPDPIRLTLRFAYVAPGQLTVFRVCKLRQDLSSLHVTVEDVKYTGLLVSGEYLREVHGVLVLDWSPKGARHERAYRLTR